MASNPYTTFEVELLEKWCKSAKNYFLLHDRAHNEYIKKNYGLTIPVIILSTLSGTASFSIQSFPEGFRSYVPMIIGGINIFVGILQTMTQFMKINELISEHRVAAVNFDKFSRNITAELSLPELERSYSGKDFVHLCRKEMDRIIEQSPIIPEHILSNLENIIKGDTITNNQNKMVGYIDTMNNPDYITINMKQIEDKFYEKISKMTNGLGKTDDIVNNVSDSIGIDINTIKEQVQLVKQELIEEKQELIEEKQELIEEKQELIEKQELDEKQEQIVD